MRHASRIAISLFVLLLAAPSLMWGQAPTTGTIIGQVTDQSGALVPGAQVTITDISTKTFQGQPTNSVGRFAFANIKPGTYDVSVVAKGFRKLTVPSQEVIVGQSVQLNLTLEVGAATQTVEVKAVPGAELQTLNSTVGATLGGDALLALPNANRDATSLLVFQPLTAPTFGGAEGNTTGGQVAGQMSDQNTFTLDGGNATDDLAGDNNYVAGNRGYVGPQGAIPTPVESIEEFKVSTNNQTADFSSSSGGQVMLVTKRGTNTFHGSAYDYFQADWLDARGWNLNSTFGTNVPTVKQHQNRFGGAFGGPILPSHWGGKTYFYGNYEGRRYPYANGRYERYVPSALMRQGVIQEPNSSGVWMQYPLKTSTQCGSTATLPCDPRGLGINPIMSQLWTKYMPLPNDCPGSGDHYNTCGFYGPLKLGIRDDFMVARMDHDFGAKWRAYASFRWFSLKDPTTDQVDIGGYAPGDTLGVPASVSNDPGNPRYYVVGVTGTLTPAVTNEFHVSMLRNDWNWNRFGVPTGNLGIPGGLEVGGETGNSLDPIDMQTQQARNRLWDGQDWTYSDSVSWLRGNHYLQVGGQFMHFYDIHARDDEVVAALTQLVYQVGNGNSDLLWTSSLYPYTCPSSGTTSATYCMSSSQRSSYEGVAAELMGIVNQAEQVFVRGGSNFALTGANTLENHTIIDSYSLYFTDSWKIRPNLTLNYGLEWGVTMPPYEKNGVQDILTDSNGNAMNFNSLMNNAQSAALNGTVNNPPWAFTPILGMGSKIKYPFDPFYGGFSPRVSLAYSPKGSSIGFLNKMFGDKKTVLRGGYVRVYDRLNSVNLVLTPLLGYGFGQPLRGIGANMNGSASNVTSSVTVANAFRVGTDGNTAPFPAATPTLPVPVIPGQGGTPGATSLTALDNKMRPGDDDQIDFTIQRELPGQLIVEAGYNGRWARHISIDLDTDAVPVMMKLGGQSFSQAYYNLFLADQKAQTTGVTPTVAAQPFFETALGGPTSAFCKGYANCTSAVEAAEGLNGTGNISFYSAWPMFQDFDTGANGAAGPGGSQWNFPGCNGCQILPTSVGHYGYSNTQSTNGYANYQAFFVTVQKRTGHGLVLSGNYSYSHTLSIYDINQEYTNYSVNYPWDLKWDYMPAVFDRTQVINILANYQLPFGKGKYFATKNPVLDRIIGGWTLSPVYSWGTGIPIETETAYGAEFGSNWNTGLDAGEVPLVNTGSFGHSAQVNYHISQTAASYLGPSQGSLVGFTNDPYKDCGTTAAPVACAPNTYGVNLFKNPAAVFNSYRPALLGLDTTTYSLGPYYGQHRWNVDITLAKETHIKENWNVTIYAQFLNALNHMEYGDPGLSYLDPADWGTLTGQYNSPRVIELGARLSF